MFWRKVSIIPIIFRVLSNLLLVVWGITLHTYIRWKTIVYLDKGMSLTSQQLNMKKFLIFIGFKESSWPLAILCFPMNTKTLEDGWFSMWKRCPTREVYRMDINTCALVMRVYWFKESSCHSYAKTRNLISVWSLMG